jgi:A/G-specific adenine glycosylase
MERMNRTLDQANVAEFRRRVYAHYEAHGRDFPWRHTTNPYHILVSEVMLQQTQTSRVVQKYLIFIERYPSVEALASASAADVLGTWQGLGYNRRALNLHRASHILLAEHGGHVPQDEKQLACLPGIGPYSAAAISAFAFDLPTVFIETNIRTVYLHEYFPEVEKVRDRDLLPLVEATLDRESPRRWYQALMDYGAMLKESGNPSRRSAHHRQQSRFEGSRREARSVILRNLLSLGPLAAADLRSRAAMPLERFDDALASLLRDGLVEELESKYRIPA